MNWDIYFLRVAKEISKKSACLSRKIGAIIVRDRSIISTGYNGPARRVKHCNDREIEFFESLDNQLSKIRTGAEDNICPRRYMGYKSGQGLHLCQAGHAERNAIVNAAKHGIATEGTTIYCFCGQVCKDCAIEIVNSGIKELVYLEGLPPYDGYADTILREGGVITRTIKEEVL